jgi:hypothetical protein
LVVFRLFADAPVHREDSDESEDGEIGEQERGEGRGTADEVFKKTPRGPVQIPLYVQEKAEATDQDLDKQNPRREPKKAAPFKVQPSEISTASNGRVGDDGSNPSRKGAFWLPFLGIPATL